MSTKRREPFLLTTNWILDFPIEELRSVLEDPLAISRWWSAVFMQVQEIEAGRSDRQGYTVRCHTKGFLPHSFQFLATITDLRADRIVIMTQGDFDGTGTIDLQQRGQSTNVSVEWRVHVGHPYIQPFLRVLKPVFSWNHRWAMRQGYLGLERALRNRSRASALKPNSPTFPHNLPGFRNVSKWRV